MFQSVKMSKPSAFEKSYRSFKPRLAFDNYVTAVKLFSSFPSNNCGNFESSMSRTSHSMLSCNAGTYNENLMLEENILA